MERRKWMESPDPKGAGGKDRLVQVLFFSNAKKRWGGRKEEKAVPAPCSSPLPQPWATRPEAPAPRRGRDPAAAPHLSAGRPGGCRRDAGGIRRDWRGDAPLCHGRDPGKAEAGAGQRGPTPCPATIPGWAKPVVSLRRAAAAVPRQH